VGRDIKPCLKRILRDAINTRGGVSCIQVSTAVNENMPKTQKSKNFRTKHWYAEKKRKQSILFMASSNPQVDRISQHQNLNDFVCIGAHFDVDAECVS